MKYALHVPKNWKELSKFEMIFSKTKKALPEGMISLGRYYHEIILYRVNKLELRGEWRNEEIKIQTTPELCMHFICYEKLNKIIKEKIKKNLQERT